MADSGDRMFCHACGGVWLRNEHGLTCPHCQSDFVEIIEIPPDTAPEPPPHAGATPINPWAEHNPWAEEENGADTHMPGGGPGLSRRTFRSPDGRFTFSTTSFSGGFPPRPIGAPGGPLPGDDPLMPMVRSLDTLFNGLADTYRQQRVGTQSMGDGFQHQGYQGHQREPNQEEPPGFAATGRLFPRDADRPQPAARTVDSLGDVLDLFRQDFGGAGVAPGGGGVRVMTGPNPLAILSSLLNFDRHGDAVYSQEEFDRIVTQLIEQNANGNAPPPAPESAIRQLPKKNVDQEMLGPDGKAECSICMDPVELGTEVTVLPCKHWFHGNCIELWLVQHNTCPHCRRPISSDTPEQANPEGTQQNPVVINDSPDPPPHRLSSAAENNSSNASAPSRQEGQSSSNPESANPHFIPDCEGANEHCRRSSRNDGGSGGGITGWFRNHLGGGTS